MAKFVNLLGDTPLSRSTFEAFKEVNVRGVESGDEVTISFAVDEDTAETAINLIHGVQSEFAPGYGEPYTSNDANGDRGLKGYMGSQYLPAVANGLFEQGLDLVENEEDEPLIWVACKYFALANNLKNRLMILPLDGGFLVALQEGVIRFALEDADDLVLARNIGNRDVDSMTFMTSSEGNIQGIPEHEVYNQSFLSVTLQRKIQHTILRKSARNGNNDKSLTTSVTFDRHGTVLLDGGVRLQAQINAEAEAEIAAVKLAERRAAEKEEAEARQDAIMMSIADEDESTGELREKAASHLASKGHRNPFAAAFLDAQTNKA